MASDISNIIKNEIVGTLESLLSASSKVTEVKSIEASALGDTQCIKVETQFSFGAGDSVWQFFVPTATATKFEYLMLGGIADLKDAIDDEISDAVKEIVSNICGSIATSINGQGFDDISGVNFSLGSSGVGSCSDTSSDKLYEFVISLNDEDLSLYILFDDIIYPYVEYLTSDGGGASGVSEPAAVSADMVPSGGSTQSILSSILSEESVENLRLLFDVKLRLSVRLGTKVCLLKDVLGWDIGEIIELTQMTNEPLDILVNGIVIGQGEAVVVDGKFGVKIKHIGEPKIN